MNKYKFFPKAQLMGKRLFRLACGNVRFIALVGLTSVAQAADGDAFAGASWIGEAGEKEMTWRSAEAKACRGITGARGHFWTGFTSPLPKHCPRFRKTFALGPESIKKAVVRVTGMGFYELWVNGRKADPLRVLAPGATSRERVLADRYDVAALLRPGTENTIGLWLVPGYSDDFSSCSHWTWLAPKRAILKLEVEAAGGRRTVVATDGTWESTPESPIVSASIYHGELYDAAKEDAAWATPRGKKDGWRAVTVFPDGPPTVFYDAPPVRITTCGAQSRLSLTAARRASCRQAMKLRPPSAMQGV